MTGSPGFDISYPQCGQRIAAPGFRVVGINGGYPFRVYNPCLRSEYHAAARVDLYLNTGYDPLYTQVDSEHSTPGCVALSADIAGNPAQQAAWAVGCSEAFRSLDYAASQDALDPARWWLDVETGNSWSDDDLSLNRYTIQGLLDMLHAVSDAPVGVYSTPDQWQAITGGQPLSGVDADWIGTGGSDPGDALAYCRAGFSGAPVSMVQYVQEFNTSALDIDLRC
jgi:hypothetical protein